MEPVPLVRCDSSVVQVSVVVDVARNATVWCSILGILGNKWCAARGPVGGVPFTAIGAVES